MSAALSLSRVKISQERNHKVFFFFVSREEKTFRHAADVLFPDAHFRIKIGSISSLLLSCHKIHANKKLYLSFALKNSSFRFKLERRKRSDLTMDATLGTENNPTVISGKTRSIVSRPFRSLFFFAAVRQVTASFAISLFLSLSLSLDVVASCSRACS